MKERPIVRERRLKYSTLSTSTLTPAAIASIIVSMTRCDLCLAWNWEHDAGLARLLDEACARRGLTLLPVTPANLDPVLAALASGESRFRVFLDRASDSDPRFQPLVDWARTNSARRINPQEQARWTHDKATMHLEFLTAGLETPHTIILPPFREQPSLPPADLGPLGGRFAIKPGRGGGGEGVVLEAGSWEQAFAVRQQFPDEKYLLQAHVTPRLLDGRPAWFRVLACGGAVYPCWWDPRTHIYARLTAEESARFGLRGLREVARRIAQICRLDLFSTEIALTAEGRFVVVDYVNDPVDLRLQSAAADGVPDAIVESIAGRLARLAERV
ncbi:MAG: hypothetical protein FD146_2317 [Anaerolineaceae bacterium]|nr:MAG: hypothetical protein FD146_2317 [Anaerolineaceae bacterium]